MQSKIKLKNRIMHKNRKKLNFTNYSHKSYQGKRILDPINNKSICNSRRGVNIFQVHK